ncbi:hypothetical protein [Paenarthrobacter aurescens]|uniref:Uncharacterized protein n=1 Tax=Paenarthrobacter aurescens TaxID=43663 RepID=A0A4Y3NGL6_PAEAU|nr:hypothetical protein [Paenarthrobacter aurescens]MDO6143364.1 hypothetical protein [Paenarthrobacter aurescens]MDO6147212.1 hypothetical protein [Paenarthrobacter aurescens]MDO6158456.1 hypothetical protein [Paenarthrobacter aurescens]MDO6162440.1 hypothetical protein [Paenarthrobacter aurescens]GEB18181.1 hypothetical protein AAU01_09360 [Paenarthrobacter aurescens]
MKLMNTSSDHMLTIKMTRTELATLADIGLEITIGALKISDNEWKSAALPATKDEACALFDELRRLLIEARQ